MQTSPTTAKQSGNILVDWVMWVALSPGILEEFYPLKFFILEIQLATIPQLVRGARLADRMRIEQKMIAHSIQTLCFLSVDMLLVVKIFSLFCS